MTKEIEFRLSLNGVEQARRGLESLGPSGRKALRELERATKPTNRSLKALDGTVNEIKDGMREGAAAAGPFGRVLASLGPAGIGLAAGVGVGVVAINRISAAATEGRLRLNELAKAADSVQIDPQAFQALREFAAQEDFQQLEEAFRKVGQAQVDVARGRGEIVERLKESHPEVLTAIKNARTQTEILDVLVKALRDARSEVDRNTLALAFFGESGREAARFFERLPGDLRETVAAADELGVLFETRLLRQAERMETQFGILSRQIDNDMIQGTFGWNAALLESKKLWAEIVDLTGRQLERLGDVSLVSERELRRRAARGRRDPGLFEDGLSALRRQGDGLAAEAELRRRIGGDILGAGTLDDRSRVSLALRSGDVSGPTDFTDPVEAARQEAEAARKRAAAIREMEAAEREALQIKVNLGDVSGVLAEREERLNDLLSRGLITRAQADETLRQYRESLDGTARAQERWTQFLEAGQTPLEALSRKEQELRADYEAGRIAIDQYTAALQELTRQRTDEIQAIEDQRQREREATLEYQGALDITDALLNDLVRGTNSLGDVTRRVFEQMAIDLLKNTELFRGFQRVLESALGSASGAGRSGGRGGGIFDALGNIFGGAAGVGTPPIVPEFHEGGLVSAPRRFRRADGAGPGEVLAMLRQGEMVLTPAQQAAVASSRSGDVYNLRFEGDADETAVSRAFAEIRALQGRVGSVERNQSPRGMARIIQRSRSLKAIG